MSNFNVWKILSFASSEIKDIGVRCWPIDSAIYLVYSARKIIDDEGKIVFDLGWQLIYNAVWDVAQRRKINKQTARIILYGIVITKTKKDNLLNEKYIQN